MLRERIISALIIGPVIIASLLLGRYFFAFLVAVIVVIGMDEFYSMLMLRELKPNIVIGILGGVVVVVGALTGGIPGVVFVLAISVIVALVWQTFTEGSMIDTGLTLVGLAYIAFTLSHMVLLYDLRSGLIGVLLVFIGTWISDISAYVFGSTIGRRKLAPAISANKTIEGSIAGLISPAVLLGILFVLPWLPFAAEQGILVASLEGVMMGLVIGLIAPIGDLVESRIKREMRVKDTGVLIPGHGGFLDRFDSIMFTAVAGYYYWLLIT
ncbi:MAG: phosphatidate cytidylyltransferase [Actinobacteria bacterium]|nr:phosphatidate cytidylyltransferase [Actinomycetota bacterium]